MYTVGNTKGIETKKEKKNINSVSMLTKIIKVCQETTLSLFCGIVSCSDINKGDCGRTSRRNIYTSSRGLTLTGLSHSHSHRTSRSVDVGVNIAVALVGSDSSSLHAHHPTPQMRLHLQSSFGLSLQQRKERRQRHGNQLWRRLTRLVLQ